MKWRLLAIAAMAAGGVWLATGALCVTQDIVARIGQFQQGAQRQVQAHAARSGGRAVLPQDNSACVLCHGNFREEELGATHLKLGITCVHCHGVSYEHADDEGHEIKPDIMFGRAEVAPFCEGCHGPHGNPEKVAAFLAEREGKRRPNGREILRQATCADRHGTHVLPGAHLSAGT